MGVLRAKVNGAWIDIGVSSGFLSGFEAEKPAVGTMPGQRFFATDTLRDYLWDGTGWIVMYEPEQTYVPALTNVTIGTGGTNSGWFQRLAGFCEFRTALNLGTGGAFTGQVAIGLPRAASTILRGMLTCQFHDTGLTDWDLGYHAGSGPGATSVTPYSPSVSGTRLSVATNVNATSPFTWGATDALAVQGRYRMNTPYL